MASLIPNTDIVLCRDVPLDSTYVNTLTFATEVARQNYFLNKAYKTVQQNSYQRVMKNRLRIECSIDDAMMCNYLYFRNNDFENKFIFAFITGWEYVNNVTTEITYEIDAFQTFWGDIKWLDVFIEREHALDDTIGANLVPENLEQGDYVVNRRSVLLPTAIENVVDATACALIYTTFNSNFTPYRGGLINYVFSGLNVIAVPDLATFQYIMVQISAEGKPEGFIAGFMCPFTPKVVDNITWQKTILKNYQTIDGYTPKNNKLFTAPYNILRISTDADAQEFKWEYFNDANYARFNMVGVSFPEPSLTLMPIEYKIKNSNISYADRMTIKNYPQIAINEDVYKVYLAQNSASLPVSILSSAAKASGNIISGMFSTPSKSAAALGLSAAQGTMGVLNNVIDFASDVAGTLAQLHDIAVKPPQLNGTQSSIADYSFGVKNFIAEALSIRSEFAQIIDEYFTMYGYATHRVKHPNVHGRRFWNYVKTRGITVDGTSIPSVYLDRMNVAFNTGITFWHMENSQGLTDIVGRYTLDNIIGT